MAPAQTSISVKIQPIPIPWHASTRNGIQQNDSSHRGYVHHVKTAQSYQQCGDSVPEQQSRLSICSKKSTRSSADFIFATAGSKTVVTMATPPIQSTTPNTCNTLS